jgi:hypothetical protein
MTNSKKVKPVIKQLFSPAAEHKGPVRLYSEVRGVKEGIDYPELAARIRRQEDSPFFVIDSSFIPRHEVDWCVWEAILEKKLVIPPMVGEELQPWLTNPFSNQRLAEAMSDPNREADCSVVFDIKTPWPEEYMNARAYCVTLLSYRKQRAWRLVKQFEERHGRSPTKEELNRLWQEVGTDRDFYLLRKGHEDVQKPNYFADEDVVATAG